MLSRHNAPDLMFYTFGTKTFIHAPDFEFLEELIDPLDIDLYTSDTRDFLNLLLRQAERGSRPTRRHPRDDPREDVGVGVVECGLYFTLIYTRRAGVCVYCTDGVEQGGIENMSDWDDDDDDLDRDDGLWSDTEFDVEEPEAEPQPEQVRDPQRDRATPLPPRSKSRQLLHA